MKHNHNIQPFEVLGRRNNITILRIPKTNKRAATRTAPKATPAKQIEEFDIRFVSIEGHTNHIADSYKQLMTEFDKI